MHAVPPLGQEQDIADATLATAPAEATSQNPASPVSPTGSHAPGHATHDAPLRDLRRVAIHPDHWYPLAWSHEVKRGKTYGTTFGGEPVVLYRTESDVVHALEDRCAHRQVPLHMGVVDGDGIRCGY